MNKILNISGNIYSIKKATQIKEMPELGEFFDYQDCSIEDAQLAKPN